MHCPGNADQSNCRQNNPKSPSEPTREPQMPSKKWAGKHVSCAVDQIHIDQGKKIVTTPAYMLGPNIKDVAAGIEKISGQGFGFNLTGNSLLRFRHLN